MRSSVALLLWCGSACGPVIVPVFKTGGRQAILSPVGSTPTRFRHFFFTERESAINSFGFGERRLASSWNGSPAFRS